MLRPWKQAARSLASRPAFALSAIAILGAGTAATTGVFSVVDAAVLQPLPYPHPDRLVLVMEANSSRTEAAGLLAPARLEDWNRLNHGFDAIAGSYAESVTETSGDEPERLAARRISARYFAVLGVPAELGRTPSSDEEVAGGPASVVISDHLWARRFQRRREALTHRLTLGGTSYAIVGVMPASFDDPRIDLWIPAQTSPFLMQARDARFMTGVGRMNPGVTVAAAQRDLARVQTELGREYPKTDRDWSAQVTDLKTTRVGQYREPLVFVLGAVALLMLIALANTAGLMLAQLQRRQTELAIRGFLGATRMQVVAGVAQEVLILALVATLGAIAADVALLRLASTALSTLPGATRTALDWRALAVASLCALSAALACGIVPAWRATRQGAGAIASRAGRGISADTRSQRLLVAGQIALATLLVATTGLMLRSYYNLGHVDPGFDASHAVTFHVGAAWDEDRTKVGQMQQRLMTDLQSLLPGVSAVGFTNFLPASSATLRFQVHLQTLGRDEASSDRERLTVGERSVTDDYFRALGGRLTAGNACPSMASLQRGSPKALVNRRFVVAYANGQDVIGRYLNWAQDSLGPPVEIIGVVGDIREDNLRTPAVPYVYACIAAGNWPDPEYVVRAAGDPRAVMRSIRAIVHGVDPSRAIFGMMPLDDNLAGTVGQTRLQTEMIAAFGVAALGLAAIGLYALVAFGVSLRRREIGIRIALGAEPRRVVRELAWQAGWLIVAGTAAGLLLAVIAQHELRVIAFGVAPLDPTTLLGAVVGLGATSAIATLVPALRAAKIDPVGAMRDG